jgi:thiol-disulfide isomerase/thioredoxin
MNTWLRTICLPLLLVIGLSACGNREPAQQNGEPQANTPAASSHDPSTATESASGPARILEAGDQRIPVFTDYAALAPIFEMKNDTTYVINFWATWCKPCVEELPYFEQLHEAFDNEKVQVILVSLDFERDLTTKLTSFVEDRRLQSDVVVLLDGNYNSWIDKVDPEWGGAIPVTIVYNAEKRQFIGTQLASYEELKSIVKSML